MKAVIAEKQAGDRRGFFNEHHCRWCAKGRDKCCPRTA